MDNIEEESLRAVDVGDVDWQAYFGSFNFWIYRGLLEDFPMGYLEPNMCFVFGCMLQNLDVEKYTMLWNLENVGVPFSLIDLHKVYIGENKPDEFGTSPDATHAVGFQFPSKATVPTGVVYVTWKELPPPPPEPEDPGLSYEEVPYIPPEEEPPVEDPVTP